MGDFGVLKVQRDEFLQVKCPYCDTSIERLQLKSHLAEHSEMNSIFTWHYRAQDESHLSKSADKDITEHYKNIRRVQRHFSANIMKGPLFTHFAHKKEELEFLQEQIRPYFLVKINTKLIYDSTPFQWKCPDCSFKTSYITFFAAVFLGLKSSLQNGTTSIGPLVQLSKTNFTDDFLPETEDSEFLACLFDNDLMEKHVSVFCACCLKQFDNASAFVKHAAEQHKIQQELTFFACIKIELEAFCSARHKGKNNSTLPSLHWTCYECKLKIVETDGLLLLIKVLLHFYFELFLPYKEGVLSKRWPELLKFSKDLQEQLSGDVEKWMFSQLTEAFIDPILLELSRHKIDCKEMINLQQSEQVNASLKYLVMEIQRSLSSESPEVIGHNPNIKKDLLKGYNRDSEKMGDLLNNIKKLDRQRIEYFLHNPSSSHANFCRKIREQSTQLQQEIPINVGGAAVHNYLVGKILNLCVDFDPKSEVHLDLACRMDPSNVDAWLELGTCVWKKPDLDKALMNFNEAVQRKRSPKALCLLSAAKRAQLSSPDLTPKERMALIQECLKLCKEALELQPDYNFGWYSLGNTHIYRFFAVGQIQDKELSSALTAYEKALTCNSSTPFINSDLHVNFGVALQRALEIEPHFIVPKDHIMAVEKFLNALQEGVDKKGSITQRRFKQIIKSMEHDKRTAHHCFLTIKQLH
uniref:C2H2-type domain-containing protein n=1 Tax=Ditylenchus dipsaci TaxID=166011 RepID=A0A915DEU0_9BILA